MENRLLTIMFTDVQGFTKRTANATREETSRFIEETRAFVSQHLEKFQGRLVKTMGDGFLAAFDSPTNAVQCGTEMQKKLQARNANILNPDHFVRFRIGVNTGEVGIDENGDLFGDAVNIAARIESFAESGEVFISESTFLAMNRNEIGTVDLGPQMFKNATREIRVYKILGDTDPKGAAKKGAGPVGGGKPTSPETWRNKPWVWALVGVLGTLLLLLPARRFLSGRKPSPPPASPDVTPPAQPPGSQTPAPEIPDFVEDAPPSQAFSPSQRDPEILQAIDQIKKAVEAGQFEKAADLVDDLRDAEASGTTRFNPKEMGWMAWVEFKAGRIEESKEILTEAIARAKDVPVMKAALEARLRRMERGMDLRPPGPRGPRNRMGGGGGPFGGGKRRDDPPQGN